MLSSLRPRPSRRARLGFTLVELVVVVVIISVFAALAIPQVTHQLRDRRVHEAAQRVAGFYRDARMHAMGRGAAVLVRYSDGPSGQGVIEVREAIVGMANPGQDCWLTPFPSCTLAAWDMPDEDRQLRLFDVSIRGEYEDVFIQLEGAELVQPQGLSQRSWMDICFTPGGRTFARYGVGQPFFPLNSVARATIFRAGAGGPVGLERRVLIPPSGAARLEL